MEGIFKKIKKLLDSKGINYKITEHEPVFTSKQAAKVRGVDLNLGAKSLLLKADKNFVLVVLPGGKKLSSKKLKRFLGTKSLRFATQEEVKEIMGCEIGSCYPFGLIVGLRVVVDSSLLENKMIFFNPGVHNKTIEIKTEDYFKVKDLERGEIIE